MPYAGHKVCVVFISAAPQYSFVLAKPASQHFAAPASCCAPKKGRERDMGEGRGGGRVVRPHVFWEGEGFSKCVCRVSVYEQCNRQRERAMQRAGEPKRGFTVSRIFGCLDVLGRAWTCQGQGQDQGQAMGSDDAVAQDEAWAQLGDLKRERVTWIVCCLVATHMDDL